MHYVFEQEESAILRGFCLFTFCNGRYSALFHTPIEPAKFNIDGHSKGNSFHRLFYIGLLAVGYLLTKW